MRVRGDRSKATVDRIEAIRDFQAEVAEHVVDDDSDRAVHGSVCNVIGERSETFLNDARKRIDL